MPTTIVSSIGTAPGRDYSTLQAWADAAPADLVAADVVWRGECYADSVFTRTGNGTMLTLTGATTSETCYRHITAAAGQSFADQADAALRIDDTKGVLIRTNNNYNSVVLLHEPHARMSRLQLSTGAAAVPLSMAYNTVGIQTWDCVIETRHANGPGVFIPNSRMWNCLVISGGTGAGVALNFSYVAGTYGRVENCTFVRPSNLARAGNAINTNNNNGYRTPVVNCAFFGYNSVGDGTRQTIVNCATDSPSPPAGFTAMTLAQAGFKNTVASTGDWRLESTSLLIDAGTDPTLTNTDILGKPRKAGSAVDIGAVEFATAAQAQVTADFSAAYAVMGRATADCAAAYAVRGQVLATMESGYAVKGRVQTDHDAAYAVLGRVLRDFDASYQVLPASMVTAEFVASYSVLGTARADLDASFAVRGMVDRQFQAAFGVRGTVTADLDAGYAVRAGVGADLAAAYSVRGRVLADLLAAYEIQGGGGGGDCPTAAQIAAAVLAREINGIPLSQILAELHQIHGLRPGVPLVVGETTRTAGDVVQAIGTSGGATTVTRQ